MQKQTFRVGEWLVLAVDNKICREGRTLVLEPRLIDMLTYFAQHPDEVLSRDELIDHVWKRHIVTNHVVTQCISELRKYLKDSRSDCPEYIVTVPKRGYKLVEKVEWLNEEESSELQPSQIYPETESEPTESPSILEPVTVSAVSTSQNEVVSTAATHSRFSTLFHLWRRPVFWVWSAFLLALITCVFFIIVIISRHLPESINSPSNESILLNPRDINIRINNSGSCPMLSNQLADVIGMSEVISRSLNSYSTFLIHDQNDYPYQEANTSGKTLYIQFTNQQHYRAQQCFLSVRMIDNINTAVMLDKRYIITSDNLSSVQTDLISSVFRILKLPDSSELTDRMPLLALKSGTTLQQYYQAYQLILQGDSNALEQASEKLGEIIKSAPDFIYAQAEKTLVDLLLNSRASNDQRSVKELEKTLQDLYAQPMLQKSVILQQIKTVDQLTQGNVAPAYDAITQAIALEMSWINYVFLGKVYELRGQNDMAADVYVTAFNLRPGENTLYWIKHAIYETHLSKVVPYLSKYDRYDKQ